MHAQKQHQSPYHPTPSSTAPKKSDKDQEILMLTKHVNTMQDGGTQPDDTQVLQAHQGPIFQGLAGQPNTVCLR